MPKPMFMESELHASGFGLENLNWATQPKPNFMKKNDPVNSAKKSTNKRFLILIYFAKNI